MKVRSAFLASTMALLAIVTACEQEERLPVMQTSVTADEIAVVQTNSEVGDVLFAKNEQGWTRSVKSRPHTHFGEAGGETHSHDLTTPTDDGGVRRLIETVLTMEAIAVTNRQANIDDSDLTVDLYRAGEEVPAVRLQVFTRSTSGGTEYFVKTAGASDLFVVPAPDIEGIFEVLRRTESLTHGH